jgi:hypothetical protein
MYTYISTLLDDPHLPLPSTYNSLQGSLGALLATLAAATIPFLCVYYNAACVFTINAAVVYLLCPQKREYHIPYYSRESTSFCCFTESIQSPHTGSPRCSICTVAPTTIVCPTAPTAGMAFWAKYKFSPFLGSIARNSLRVSKGSSVTFPVV